MGSNGYLLLEHRNNKRTYVGKASHETNRKTCKLTSISAVKEIRVYGDDLVIFQAISDWPIESRPGFLAGALHMGLVVK